MVPAILLEIWWFFIDHCYINRLVFWNCIFLFTDIAQLWKCKKCTYMVNVSLQLRHLIIFVCGPSCWTLFDHHLWFLFQSTLHLSNYINLNTFIQKLLNYQCTEWSSHGGNHGYSAQFTIRMSLCNKMLCDNNRIASLSAKWEYVEGDFSESS